MKSLPILLATFFALSGTAWGVPAENQATNPTPSAAASPSAIQGPPPPPAPPFYNRNRTNLAARTNLARPNRFSRTNTAAPLSAAANPTVPAPESTDTNAPSPPAPVPAIPPARLSPLAVTNLAPPAAAGTNALRTAPPRLGRPPLGPGGAGGPPQPMGPPPAGGTPAGPPGEPPIGEGSFSAVITPNSTNLSGIAGSTKIPDKLLNLQTTPIDQVLMVYAELSGRTVLRPTQLPASTVTLRNQQELTKDEALQALESVLGLNGITLINVGEKFVTAVPTQQALAEAAAFSKTDPKDMPETGQFVTRVIKLTNAIPTEIQQFLQTFSKVPNGTLAIDSTSTLVLRDYPANIKRMTEIIEKIDVRVESDYKLEVIPIKYGRVEEIYGTMSSLIGGSAGGGIASSGTGTGAQGLRTSMGSVRTGRGSGSLRSGSSRSGYGSSSGSYGSGYNRSGSYYPQQAAPPLAAPQIDPQGGEYVPMQAASPTPAVGGSPTFSQRLQQVVSKVQGQQELQLLGNCRIVPDERSNSLIVYATKADMMMLTNIVSKVDSLLAQVLIEAIIMEVDLTDSWSFGVTALMRPQQNGQLTSVSSMNNGASLLSGMTNLSNLAEGFNYYGQYAGDMDIAVKAIAANGRGHILATPRVQTSHAMTATFTVGESVPYVSSTYYGGYSYSGGSSLQQLDVETYLTVTPYITPDGLVVMEIDQNIEEITGYTEIANVGKMPNTTRRSAQATVSVQDKDTIILGGYIRTSKSNSKSGIPLLKDIPLLGNLFRSTSKDSKRSETLILIRPTVLPTPRDAARMAETQQNRMPGVREMNKDMLEDEEGRMDRADKVTGKKKRSKDGKQPLP